MNYSQFLYQIENLMYTQQAKNKRYTLEKVHYKWLIKKKVPLTFLSSKDEYAIRQAMQKVEDEQKGEIIKRLLQWLQANPTVEFQKIPEMCVELLNDACAANLINTTTAARKLSFRKQLMHLFVLSNQIFPIECLHKTPTKRKRVNFRNELTVFSITD